MRGGRHGAGMSDRTPTTRARLADEWAHLSTRPATLRHAATWTITAHPPTSLDEIVAAVGGGNDRSVDADRRLRALVERARTDDLAARVVIERLLPGLFTAARRRRPSHVVFDELLAAAWISIRTYNPARRNSNIAASLLADTEWHAYRRQERRRSEEPIEVDDVPALAETVDPGSELAEVLDTARAAGVAHDDLRLIQLLATHASTEDVARILQVTARTIRNRRERVTAELRRVAVAA